MGKDIRRAVTFFRVELVYVWVVTSPSRASVDHTRPLLRFCTDIRSSLCLMSDLFKSSLTFIMILVAGLVNLSLKFGFDYILSLALLDC